MSEHGVVTEPATIRFERVLPGPIERVWAYITESAKRGKWLATGDMDLRVGGKVELNFRHADLSPKAEKIPEKYKALENGASFTGTITRCEPPRLLSHTWAEGWGGDSEVTYELSERGEDVLLVLTHRRLGGRDEMLSVAGGWHTHLDILADNLAGRTPEGFWAAHSRWERDYETRIPPV